MRRALILLSLLPALFIGSQNLSAQDFRKEVTIGWAGNAFGDIDRLLPYRDRMSDGGEMLDYIFSDYDGPTYITGNIVAEINFIKKKRWTFSLAFAADGLWKNKYDNVTGQKTGRVSGYSATVMPQVRFNWINREVMKLYSSVGLGLSVGSFAENSETWGCFQLGLLGIQVGRRFFVFGEAGCGMLYMGGKFGVGYRF
ncbi:MAG: hypothetical protein IKY48_01380 [Bacteroidales bacterium]|nr:hypothetical protein [Bacteroidales bacterium]